MSDEFEVTPTYLMRKAINEAKFGVSLKHGGPFGAVIVSPNGKNIVAKAHNTVLVDNDPTAHAEINAIRAACHTLKTHDLSGYIMYCTGQPCPMCLAACEWANLKTVYYAEPAIMIDSIGFRDDKMFHGDYRVAVEQHPSEECDQLFLEYARDPGNARY